MNSKDASSEDIVDNYEIDEMTPSVDDFIKELEEKEKTLDISSDLVIEVGESEVEHDNIHDSFVPATSKTNAPNQFQVPQSIPAVDMSQNQNFAELEEKVSALVSERDDLKDTMNRRQRDFDNYRNRMERERKDTFKNILSHLATQILPVLDNLNRALDANSDAEATDGQKEFKTFVDGIALVNQQLNEVLMEMGVQPIPSVGKPFDPNFHEAVASVETDKHPHRTVIQELLRGYKIDDKVIRASMVKVSSSTNQKPSSSEKSD